LETAVPIAKRCGLTVSVDDALIEWSLLSRWAGTPWADLPTTHPGELEAYIEHPRELDFAAESLEALAGRMVDAIRTINERHDAGDVVIVGHQDPIQAARLALTGRDFSRLHVDKPKHASVITLTPGTPWRELTRWEPDSD
jgi:broad specificity phosphatase PhoE